MNLYSLRVPDEVAALLYLSCTLSPTLNSREFIHFLFPPKEQMGYLNNEVKKELETGQGLGSRNSGVYCFTCRSLLGNCIGGGIKPRCPLCITEDINYEWYLLPSWAAPYNSHSLLSYFLDAINYGCKNLKELEDYQYVSSS